MQAVDPTRFALRMLRERQGLTQLELAGKARMGKARVSGYESGKERPTPAALDRLLRALDASHLEFHLLAELLKPAAGALAARLDGDAGPTTIGAPPHLPLATPGNYEAMLRALRSNVESSARLLDALERGFLEAASARGLAPE